MVWYIFFNFKIILHLMKKVLQIECRKIIQFRWHSSFLNTFSFTPSTENKHSNEDDWKKYMEKVIPIFLLCIFSVDDSCECPFLFNLVVLHSVVIDLYVFTHCLRSQAGIKLSGRPRPVEYQLGDQISHCRSSRWRLQYFDFITKTGNDILQLEVFYIHEHLLHILNVIWINKQNIITYDKTDCCIQPGNILFFYYVRVCSCLLKNEVFITTYCDLNKYYLEFNKKCYKLFISKF